jgi:hypothetical protein
MAPFLLIRDRVSFRTGVPILGFRLEVRDLVTGLADADLASKLSHIIHLLEAVSSFASNRSSVRAAPSAVLLRMLYPMQF